MDTLKQQIEQLQSISEQLEPQSGLRDQYWNALQSFSNEFLNSLPHRPAYSAEKETPGSLALGTTPKSFPELLSIYKSEVVSKGINPASGGHLGYIPGGGLFASSLGDYLAAVTNEYAGMYFASPGAVAMENELLDWLKKTFHFPEHALGNLTSGGSIANLIALTAARDHHNVRSEKIRKSVIYVSEQVHHCIQKALRIIGLEEVTIRYIALDPQFRMQPDDLSRQIVRDLADGLSPFLVIASAGTTDTGAIDPLEKIGAIARKYQLWFHVDGAYGGFFILTPEKKDAFKGIEKADSLVIDPHKGLFLPYGIGAVLIQHREAVFHSHHYTANYMQDALEDLAQVNPADVSPELTKHFRGLRMWLPLQLYGIAPFIACLEEKLLLTRYFRMQLKNLGFRLGPEPDLSVSYFWYPVPDGDENAFNQALMRKIHEDGTVFLSSTKLQGKFVIRMALLSFRTKLDTIDRALSMIEKARKAVSLK